MAGTSGIADCVRSHVAWMTRGARAGGEIWRDGTTAWAWVPADRTVHGMFPVDPHPDDVAAAVARADALGARSTSIWSAEDAERPWLEDLGFEVGWQPWWMTAEPAAVPRSAPTHPDDRVGLVERTRPHDAARAALVPSADVLLAEATVGGAWAGRAWLHLNDEVAGLYDMGVWPRFQRRGLGRAMLGELAAEGARRGAQRITLNATPDGAELYRACGFRMLGAGRTWWRHRA